MSCPTCGGRGWHTAGGNDPAPCGRCRAGAGWYDAGDGQRHANIAAMNRLHRILDGCLLVIAVAAAIVAVAMLITAPSDRVAALGWAVALAGLIALGARSIGRGQA